MAPPRRASTPAHLKTCTTARCACSMPRRAARAPRQRQERMACGRSPSRSRCGNLPEAAAASPFLHFDRQQGDRRNVPDQAEREIMPHTRIMAAEDAVALVRPGATITVSSSSGLGCPDAVLRALGERFAATGQPRGLTLIHPIAAGDMYGVAGMDHLAQRGLLKR